MLFAAWLKTMSSSRESWLEGKPQSSHENTGGSAGDELPGRALVFLQHLCSASELLWNSHGLIQGSLPSQSSKSLLSFGVAGAGLQPDRALGERLGRNSSI